MMGRPDLTRREIETRAHELRRLKRELAQLPMSPSPNVPPARLALRSELREFYSDLRPNEKMAVLIVAMQQAMHRILGAAIIESDVEIERTLEEIGCPKDHPEVAPTIK